MGEVTTEVVYDFTAPVLPGFNMPVAKTPGKVTLKNQWGAIIETTQSEEIGEVEPDEVEMMIEAELPPGVVE